MKRKAAKSRSRQTKAKRPKGIGPKASVTASRTLVAAILETHPRKPRKTPAMLERERTAADLSVVETHKARARWFQARESWPVREAPVDSLIKERTRAEFRTREAVRAGNWQEAGPTNIGGRTTSIIAHPANPDNIIVGAAGGGVWTSNDGGKSWVGRWHKQPSLNIGSLAFAPLDPETVYCGTGEANLSADSHPGIGLFRSLDFGITWQMLAAADANGLPKRIGAIAVDPNDSSRVLIGGVNHVPATPTGMFASVDSGVSWTHVPIIGSPYRCHAIIFHPARAGWVFAAIDNAGGAQSGIWRSKNHGSSWTRLSSGLPAGFSFDRASLAIAPSAPDAIYSLVSTRNSAVLGVFRSTDGGDNWTNVAGTHFANERQMSYNNTIAVHPTNANHLVCGGVDIHRTTDGGTTWTTVTKWHVKRGNSDYAHADQHCMVMPASRAGLVYAVNDGGLDVSTDGGQTWENRSAGLATNMFYDLELARSEPKFYGGGAQDNGTVVTFDATPGGFTEIMGGDGGWLVIDPENPFQHMYANVQFMRLFRFRSPDWTDVSPPENSSDKPWMAFTVMDPADSNTVYSGSNAVWKTTNDGGNWNRVSPRFDGSPITALEVCRADSKRIYVATENGNIFKSEDGGGSWSQNLSNTTIPGFTITRIKASPDDADRVFVTVANFGVTHVFRSDDAGANWTDVDSGELPDVPHHSIAISESQPNKIFVANDVGVFVSSNAGGAWRNLTGNLPNVPVVDLMHHDATNTLLAATYGRSIWKIEL
jgi:photosystem II stability/assembly factor-like uncharacterized protein